MCSSPPSRSSSPTPPRWAHLNHVLRWPSVSFSSNSIKQIFLSLCFLHFLFTFPGLLTGKETPFISLWWKFFQILQLHLSSFSAQASLTELNQDDNQRGPKRSRFRHEPGNHLGKLHSFSPKISCQERIHLKSAASYVPFLNMTLLWRWFAVILCSSNIICFNVLSEVMTTMIVSTVFSLWQEVSLRRCVPSDDTVMTIRREAPPLLFKNAVFPKRMFFRMAEVTTRSQAGSNKDKKVSQRSFDRLCLCICHHNKKKRVNVFPFKKVKHCLWECLQNTVRVLS